MKKTKIILVYESRTGNVEKFCQKLALKTAEIEMIKLTNENASQKILKPVFLVTYTDGYGKIPPKTLMFINKNYRQIVGVVSSGNRNWGTNFAKAGKTIADKLKVPLIRQLELSGTKNDVDETFLAMIKIMEAL